MIAFELVLLQHNQHLSLSCHRIKGLGILYDLRPWAIQSGAAFQTFAYHLDLLLALRLTE